MKYAVYYHAGASTWIEVEAGDEAEAMEKADEMFETPELCYHCSRQVDLSEWQPVNGEAAVQALG